jgi:hypothetical protein
LGSSHRNRATIRASRYGYRNRINYGYIVEGEP